MTSAKIYKNRQNKISKKIKTREPTRGVTSFCKFKKGASESKNATRKKSLIG